MCRRRETASQTDLAKSSEVAGKLARTIFNVERRFTVSVLKKGGEGGKKYAPRSKNWNAWRAKRKIFLRKRCKTGKLQKEDEASEGTFYELATL